MAIISFHRNRLSGTMPWRTRLITWPHSVPMTRPFRESSNLNGEKCCASGHPNRQATWDVWPCKRPSFPEDPVLHCSVGLQSEGIQVAIQIAYKHPPFCHRRPAKKDRARSGIGVSEETVAICCIEQIDLGPLCYYYYTVNHCDRTKHR